MAALGLLLVFDFIYFLGGAGYGNRAVGVDMHEVNAVMAGVIILGAVAVAAVRLALMDLETLLRLSAWAQGEALYRAHMDAERHRARRMAKEMERQALENHGIELVNQ